MVPAETRKITWRCSPDVDRCSHMFEIHGYTLQAEGLGVGKTVVRSATFAVGGYDWSISYYPDGYYGQESSGYASVYIDFMSNKTCPAGTKVSGHFRFRLFNPATGEFRIMLGGYLPFKHTVNPNGSHAWGSAKFIDRRWLQTSPYLCHDRLTIVCDLSVLVGSRVSGPESTETCENEIIIEVPPSNLSENLEKLLDMKEGADVTFKVKGVVFHAHKVVLAARSPVFKAELYGLIGERKTCRHGHIAIQDMEPGVFKALLHFIYTDSLPAANGDCDLDDEGVVKHLLVAADRYAMDRMRLMCESMLCKRLDVDNVAAILALADQHYCCKLKDACVSFMSSPKRIKDVMATQGYDHLKKACPSIVMNLLEESVKSSVC